MEGKIDGCKKDRSNQDRSLDTQIFTMDLLRAKYTTYSYVREINNVPYNVITART